MTENLTTTTAAAVHSEAEPSASEMIRDASGTTDLADQHFRCSTSVMTHGTSATLMLTPSFTAGGRDLGSGRLSAPR